MRAVGMWETSLTLNSNGADSHFCHFAYVTWYTCIYYLCHLTWRELTWREGSVFPALQYALALKRKKIPLCGWWLAGRPFHETTKKMSETRILVKLLRMYFPRNWEFGSALSKLWNFGGGGWTPQTTPSVHHWLQSSIANRLTAKFLCNYFLIRTCRYVW
jgi:hypothetical protein